MVRVATARGELRRTMTLPMQGSFDGAQDERMAVRAISKIKS